MKNAIICLAMFVMTFTGKALASGLVKTENTTKTEFFNGTPLCIAVIKGDTESVKKFLEYGADVNETLRGMTPLMYAAYYNQKDILVMLIEKGANVKTKDQRGKTALDYATEAKATEIIEILKVAAKK